MLGSRLAPAWRLGSPFPAKSAANPGPGPVRDAAPARAPFGRLAGPSFLLFRSFPWSGSGGSTADPPAPAPPVGPHAASARRVAGQVVKAPDRADAAAGRRDQQYENRLRRFTQAVSAVVNDLAANGYIARDASGWKVVSGAWQAAVPPGAADDAAAGFYAGALWCDTAAQRMYVCVSAAAGAAVWKAITS